MTLIRTLATITLGAALALPSLASADLRSPGKPGAPVTLRHERLDAASAGQPVTIRLHYATDRRAGILNLRYTTDSGLSLQSAPAASLDLARDSLDAQVTVTASADGLYHLNVFANLDGEARSFAVPVIVGKVDLKAALKPAGKLTSTPEGRTLISLPAAETVRTGE